MIEDSLNKDSEDNTMLKARVQQLECQIVKLNKVIVDEKNKK